jgi:hypothetical protein
MGTRWLVLGLTCLSAQALEAQMKLSGEGTCAKPEVAHSIPVGDRPDHTFSITQTKCTWTKPFEIARTQAQGGTAIQFNELSGNTSRFHGHYLDLMSNGDTVHYGYQGTTTLKDGVPQSAAWSWTLTGRTGKLKDLKGRGTCQGTWNPEGLNTWRCAGQYRLPK